MRVLKALIRSLLDTLCGKRHVSLYFSTLTITDSLLAILYSIAVMARLPVARGGKAGFKSLVTKTFGTKEIFLYGSARSALYAHLKALDLMSGAEVIITGFTCEVVPNAVINAGLKPVYADIDQESYCMTVESARKVVTAKTRVIIVQHTFGIAAELDTLLDFAREHDLYVIEDCAVSLGTLYNEQLTGTFGDAAIFSFELSKTITSCWGGMLLINTEKLDGCRKQLEFYQKVPQQQRCFSSHLLMQLGLSGLLFRPVLFNIGKYATAFMYGHGYFKKSTSDEELKASMPPGYLYALSDQQAVLLSRQLKRLDQITAQSRSIIQYYQNNLTELPGIIVYRCPKGAKYNMIRYPIRCNDRQRFVDAFQSSNVDIGIWFTAPLSSPEVDHALFGYQKGDCPVAEKVSEIVCNLPTNLRVTETDCAAIVSRCRNVAQLVFTGGNL